MQSCKATCSDAHRRLQMTHLGEMARKSLCEKVTASAHGTRGNSRLHERAHLCEETETQQRGRSEGLLASASGRVFEGSLTSDYSMSQCRTLQFVPRLNALSYRRGRLSAAGGRAPCSEARSAARRLAKIPAEVAEPASETKELHLDALMQSWCFQGLQNVCCDAFKARCFVQIGKGSGKPVSYDQI